MDGGPTVQLWSNNNRLHRQIHFLLVQQHVSLQHKHRLSTNNDALGIWLDRQPQVSLPLGQLSGLEFLLAQVLGPVWPRHRGSRPRYRVLIDPGPRREESVEKV